MLAWLTAKGPRETLGAPHPRAACFCPGRRLDGRRVSLLSGCLVFSSRAAIFILIIIVAAGWFTGEIPRLLSLGVVGWVALGALAWLVAIMLARRIDWEAEEGPSIGRDGEAQELVQSPAANGPEEQQ